MRIRLAGIWYQEDQNEPSAPFCLEFEARDKADLFATLEDYAHQAQGEEDPGAMWLRNETTSKLESFWGDIRVERADGIFLFVSLHPDDKEILND